MKTSSIVFLSLALFAFAAGMAVWDSKYHYDF